MKSMILWLFIAIGPCLALAQSKVTKSYPVTKGQTIDLRFDYPKIVRLSTWEGNELVIEATVKINNGESNNAFSLKENITGDKISISNKLDMDAIPNSYYIVDQGIKTRFNSKNDMDAYVAQKGSGSRISYYSTQDIEITINIKVPVGISTDVLSTYGMVEVQNFKAPISVKATYGGVDASVTEAAIGKLQLTTRYGKIFSNLSLKPTEQTQKDFFTSITATPGSGPSYDLSSSYGNIYLRSSIK